MEDQFGFDAALSDREGQGELTECRGGVCVTALPTSALCSNVLPVRPSLDQQLPRISWGRPAVRRSSVPRRMTQQA